MDELRTGCHRGVDEPRIEDQPRDAVRGLPRFGDHLATEGATQPQLTDRHETFRRVGQAELGEHRQCLRGDAVSAGLVTGEAGYVDQCHPGTRPGLQRGKRGSATGRSGADDNEVEPPCGVAVHRRQGRLVRWHGSESAKVDPKVLDTGASDSAPV